MQSVIIAALLGCIAAVSALTLVRPREEDSRISGLTTKTHSSYSSEKHVKVTKNGHVVKQYDSVEGDSSRIGGEGHRLKLGNVLQYNFDSDFDELVNPLNSNSDWRWAMTSYNKEHVANFGTFLRDDRSKSVDLVSIPFKGWVPQDDTRVPPIANSYQAVLVNKENITVLNGQKLSVNVKFACSTFNNEFAPLAASHKSVSKPEDDPTLAACGFGICSNDESALIFSIVATNNGIWAVYERNRYELFLHPERRQRLFATYKRIGSRQSRYDTIDANIKYDRFQGKVYYLLNNEIVYTLSDLGTLNQAIREDSGYSNVYSQDRSDLVRAQPENFQVYFGLTQFPDTIDPSNPSNPPLSNVRLTTDPEYYDVKTRFEDNENMQQNVQWGQGASMTLVSAEIKLSESILRSGRRVPPLSRYNHPDENNNEQGVDNQDNIDETKQE